MLHPEYPIVEGKYQMTKEWSVDLPLKFNRRFEDDSLVIWRPGFTMWIVVWGNNHNETPKERLAWTKKDISEDSFDIMEEEDSDILRYSYRLKEESEDNRLPAFYCFAIGRKGHVQLAIYFDNKEDIETAHQIWRSLREK
jgi:hypothetical protein